MSLRFSVNEKCTSCMACVRVCPVEAIAVSGNQVRIDPAACIECGLCVPSCYHDAIDVVGDIERCVESIDEDRALLILPNEISVFFFPATPEQILNACFEAGFRTVYFEAIGDELVAAEYLRLWNAGGFRSWLRSTSPVVVNYCRMRAPELLPFLAPVVTPAIALARHIRCVENEDLDIVYSGFGAPGSNGTQDELDICISFDELEKLLTERGAKPLDQPQTLFRLAPDRRRHLSLSGGLPRVLLEEQRQTSRTFRKERDLKILPALARALLEEETPLGFVDILPFEGNLGHPAFGPGDDLYWRKEIAELSEPPRSHEPVVQAAEELDLRTFFEPKRVALEVPDQAEVEEVLEKIGTTPDGRYWNTGSCGHATCIEFAQAVARGRSTLSLCPIYLARQYEQASRDAMHDALTGVYTFRVLSQRLEEELSRASRTGTSIAILFVDLDKFKPVNDIHGHAAGNLILRSVARILSEATRSTDIVCRYGGDEFVVILVNPDREGAGHVAEQIRERVADMRIATNEGYAGVTLSVGVAYHSGVTQAQVSAEDLMAEADAALYVAKAQGGNTIHPAIGGKLVR
ncbi:MAG: diguanylate cyclase [Candidatus Palauibacterales bacterium]|nr:diguanylate cyclase [Candidatus Palauibacterales bacterium]